MLNATIFLSRKEIVEWLVNVLGRQGKCFEKRQFTIFTADEYSLPVGSHFALRLELERAEPLFVTNWQLLELLMEEATFRGFQLSPLGGTCGLVNDDRSLINVELMVQLPERMSGLAWAEHRYGSSSYASRS